METSPHHAGNYFSNDFHKQISAIFNAINASEVRILKLSLLWIGILWYNTVFSQFDSLSYWKFQRSIRNNPSLAALHLDSLKQCCEHDHNEEVWLELSEINVNIALGQYDKAMAQSLEALAQMKDTVPQYYIQYLKLLGNIYYFTRQRKAAISTYELTLDYINRYNLSKSEAAKLHSNLGGMYAEENELTTSETHLRKSIELYEKAYSKDISNISSLPYRLLGTNYWMQNRYAEARNFLRKAIDQAYLHGDKLEIIGALLFYGDNLEKSGQIDSALYYYESGRKLAAEVRNNDMHMEAFMHLKKGYAAINDFERAHYYSDSALGLHIGMYKQELASRISQMEVAYQTNKLRQEGEVREALLEAEIARSQTRQLILISLVILIIVLLLIGYILLKQQRLKRLAGEQTALIKLQSERLRISRELHDNIGAQITVIISSIDQLEYQFRKDGHIDLKRISRLSDYTRQTMQELRETVWAMKRETISAAELDSKIREYVNRIDELCPEQRFILNLNGPANLQLDPVQAMNIYRIIQEAIQNSLKHSSAKTITITTSGDIKKYKAQVSDDGSGFELETPEGNGIAHMKKRAEQANLQLKIQSSQGTEVFLSL